MTFVHLKLKTEYSLCKSTIKISKGVKYAKERNFSSLGIADDGNMFGGLEFSLECVKNGIKPILGCTINAEFEKKIYKITLISKDDYGYKNLLNVSSRILDSPNETSLPFSEKLKQFSGGLICLNPNVDENFFDYLHSTFLDDNLYSELSRYTDFEEEIQNEKLLIDLSVKNSVPIVATNDSYFLVDSDIEHEAADILQCIGKGAYYDDEKRERQIRNAFFQTEIGMQKLFEDIPEALENTVNIALRCSFCPTTSKPILPMFTEDEDEALKQMTKDGFDKRHKSGELLGLDTEYNLENYSDRLDFEIDIIEKMGFCGYFLIVSDFMKWGKENDVPIGPGRGSGAGSLVAFCLEITDLDPLYYGLIFERFLNPERVSMPDFDIDFCQEKRESVINYVKELYGKANVAAIITFGKLQAKAVLKDVGRVLSLPYKRVDDICKMIPFNPVNPISLGQAIEMDSELKGIREAGESGDTYDEKFAKLLSIGLILEGLNRHSSTHAAGIIIANQPLIDKVPLYQSGVDELPAVGYSMKTAEMAGLVKFDFLGLKTLTIIANTQKLVKKHHDIDIVLADIGLQDEKAFELLQAGSTKGIFQLDSFICRESMREIKVNKIQDVIALTSLNRPGPMENIPSYIRRTCGAEVASYYHPLLEDMLKETYGIIIYQEQVMRIAQILAGYSLGQADILRRAMGKKIKAEMEDQRITFIEGAKKNDISDKVADDIFHVIEKFAGYGFNKSHAAAYSVISLQTAYLKAHHQLEFFIANLNILIHDTNELNLFIMDAKKCNIEIKIPDVNRSEALFSADSSCGAILYALSAIKGVGIKTAEAIVREREKDGDFLDIFDFCRRVGSKVLSKKQLESLAFSNAFSSFVKNSRQVVEGIENLTSYMSSLYKEEQSKQDSLFDIASSVSVGVLLPEVSEYSQDEALNNEFSAIGFYLSFNPILRYIEQLNENRFIQSDKIRATASSKEKKIKMCGVVNIVKQRSGAKGRFCFIYLTDAAGVYETSIFNENLINAKKHLIEVGKIVSLDVSILLQENKSVRSTVLDICDLSTTLAKIVSVHNVSKKNKELSTEKQKRRTLLTLPVLDKPSTKLSDNCETKPEENVLINDSKDISVSWSCEALLRIEIKTVDKDAVCQMSQIFQNVKNRAGTTVVQVVFNCRVIVLSERYDITSSVIEQLQKVQSIEILPHS